MKSSISSSFQSSPWFWPKLLVVAGAFSLYISYDASLFDAANDVVTSSKNSNINTIPGQFQRSLRGGSSWSGGRSYSGGSSSRYSGGGSSFYNSGGRRYNNNNNSSSSSTNNNNRNSSSGYRRNGSSRMAKVLAGVAAGIFGLALLAMLLPAMAGAGLCSCCAACLAAACCGLFAAKQTGQAMGGSSYNNSNNNNNNESSNQGGGNWGFGDNGGLPSASSGGQKLYDPETSQHVFEHEVQKAKTEVESTTSNNTISQPSQPYSGQYSAKYVEQGIIRDATVHLYFQDVGVGFRISGKGNDMDGTTIVEDGFARYDGSAWWIERTISGKVGLQVLSTGNFNFQQQIFEGKWLANTMESEAYLSFAVTTATPGNPPYSHATPQGQKPFYSSNTPNQPQNQQPFDHGMNQYQAQQPFSYALDQTQSHVNPIPVANVVGVVVPATSAGATAPYQPPNPETNIVTVTGVPIN